VIRRHVLRTVLIAVLPALLAIPVLPVGHTLGADPAAEQRLLASIPGAIRTSCKTYAGSPHVGQVAAVQCLPADVQGVGYYLFESRDSMAAVFEADRRGSPGATGQDCASGPSYSGYTIGGQNAGQLLCDLIQGQSFIEWTDERLNNLTVGIWPSADYGAQYTWWLNKPGPDLPASTSPSGPRLVGIPPSQTTGAALHHLEFATSLASHTDTNGQTSLAPQGISDVFKTGTPTIIVLLSWENVPNGTEFSIRVFKDDRLFAEKTAVPNNPADPAWDYGGGFALSFSPQGGFAAGNYSVELDSDGLPEEVAPFDVTDAGGGLPLPGLLAGTSAVATNLGAIPYADPAAVLVVTRGTALRATLGQQADAVLAAARSIGTLADLDAELGAIAGRIAPERTVPTVRAMLSGGRYRYLLILGNDDVVPMAHIELLKDVQFAAAAEFDLPVNYVVSDDPYVDLDGDHDQVPDMAVARIPNSDDAQLLLTQLADVTSQPSSGFALLNASRRFAADGPLGVINGITPVTLYFAPPTLAAEIPGTNQASARYVYVLGHGIGTSTDAWNGEIPAWQPLDPTNLDGEYVVTEDQQPPEITVAQAGAPGAVVDVGSCYGAYTLDTTQEFVHKTAQNSLALKYLKTGSRAFIGDTYLSSSTPSHPGGKLWFRTGFEVLLWQGIAGGACPIDAFFSAKQQLARLMAEALADKNGDGKADDAATGDGDFLALHEMIYLGRP
jgi:hypothetical protein